MEFDGAPIEIWRQAEKAAKRSTIRRHKTGAVIFDKKGEIISDGCSYYPVTQSYPSIHAEANAIQRANGGAEGASIVIATLTKANNHAASSRPCLKCLLHMNKVGLGMIIYAERQNDGEWIVNKESPLELLNRTSLSWGRTQGYAKDMRT